MPHILWTAIVPPLLLALAWKSLPLFAVAGLACLLLRRASAAARHAALLVALTGLLLLPVFCLLLPRWSAPVLPVAPRPRSQMATRAPLLAPTAAPAASVDSAAAAESQPSVLPSAPALPAAASASAPALAAPPPAKPAPNPLRLTVADWVSLAWLTGALLALGRTLLGLAAAARLIRRCRPVMDGPLMNAADEAQRTLRLTRPVSVRVGAIAVPMTCGLVRPLILLPMNSDAWPADRLRAVLLHEAAHVRRADWATGLLAQAACALYWWHPLVWLMVHRLRVEAETACDDIVLTCGIPAPDYAAHLLDIVQGLSARRHSPLSGTVAMASRPEVAGRLRTILDARKPRGGVPRRRLALAGLAALVLIAPLAALRPIKAANPAPADATNTGKNEPVRTLSWVMTTQTYDASGRKIAGQDHRTIYWVRRLPPAFASINATVPGQETVEKEADTADVARRVDECIRGFTLYPTASAAPQPPLTFHSTTQAFTPWKQKKVILNGIRTLLFTRDIRSTTTSLTGGKYTYMLHVRVWFDTDTHRVIQREEDVTQLSPRPPGLGHVVALTQDIRYNQEPPPGVFDPSLTPGAIVPYPLGSLHPAIGFRRYVSRPLPDGTRYTFLYPSYYSKTVQGAPDTKNYFDCVLLTCDGIPPIPWEAAHGRRIFAERMQGKGGTSWPAPHEEFITVVVGHTGTLAPGTYQLRRNTQWVGPNGSHHALAVTDIRTHLRFLLNHEDRYTPALFAQTDPVICGSFQVLPPGVAPPQSAPTRQTSSMRPANPASHSPTSSASPSPQSRRLTDANLHALLLAGLTIVQAPGIIVTLNDSAKKLPANLELPEIAPPNIIHDTDIRRIINELKIAGAQAITVNDQYLVPTSAVFHAGPTVYVNHEPQTSPYIIRAIGDPTGMIRALNGRGGFADARWAFDPAMVKIAVSPRLKLPAYLGNWGDVPDQYAKPVPRRAPWLTSKSIHPTKIIKRLSAAHHQENGRKPYPSWPLDRMPNPPKPNAPLSKRKIDRSNLPLDPRTRDSNNMFPLPRIHDNMNKFAIPRIRDNIKGYEHLI